MRSRISVGAAGLTLVGLLVVGMTSACGPGDDAELETSTTEVAPSWNGDLERDRVLDEIEAREDAEQVAGHDPETCRAVGAAAFFLSSYGIHRFQLADDAARAAWDAQAAAMISAVPPDLHDELEVIRSGSETFAREIASMGLGGLVDPALQRRRDDAQASFSTPEMTQAADTIEAYLRSCPAL